MDNNNSTHNFLIIGGTGGIGLAMIQQLLQDNPIATGAGVQIFATYHNREPSLQAENLHWLPMDVTEEASIAATIADIKAQTTQLHWVINAVGLLHTATEGPEKSIRQLEPEYFMQNMKVNALPSLLIAKHIKPLLKPAAATKTATTMTDAPATIYATISARVGSITDNRVGGWYSYRMSKAALNMGMKTLSIEWARTLKQVCVVVLQPGTVDTELSKPFQGNVPEEKLFTAEYSAEKLLSVLADMSAEQTGSFVDWSGAAIPW
ncbi:SDR family oxidoreductase [Psychrobacter arenosus]|uniref:SDR family oxidoreductase n=1 Tax=Psychrobacter arenosus TaxID=256326 RepID=UPI001917ED23|nr:SDR family oxidoreductase [Psychrobacter arenosus]